MIRKINLINKIGILRIFITLQLTSLGASETLAGTRFVVNKVAAAHPTFSRLEIARLSSRIKVLPMRPSAFGVGRPCHQVFDPCEPPKHWLDHLLDEEPNELEGENNEPLFGLVDDRRTLIYFRAQKDGISVSRIYQDHLVEGANGQTTKLHLDKPLAIDAQEAYYYIKRQARDQHEHYKLSKKNLELVEKSINKLDKDPDLFQIEDQDNELNIEYENLFFIRSLQVFERNIRRYSTIHHLQYGTVHLLVKVAADSSQMSVCWKEGPFLLSKFSGSGESARAHLYRPLFASEVRGLKRYLNTVETLAKTPLTRECWDFLKVLEQRIQTERDSV